MSKLLSFLSYVTKLLRKKEIERMAEMGSECSGSGFVYFLSFPPPSRPLLLSTHEALSLQKNLLKLIILPN